MKNIILFDHHHTAGEVFSKHVFQIDQAMTIMAAGLHEEDEITFEILHFEASPKDNCNCFLTVKMPTLVGVQQLVCADCDDNLDPYPVRLTLKNPVVILNVPQGAYIRARYEGPGIGASRVWAYRDTALRSDLTYADARGTFAYIPPELRGCPPVPCVSDEWKPTGNLRCGEVDPVSAMYDVEAEYVNECGETEWREEEPRLAVDTGQKRCEESLEDDYLTEKEVITDCGKTAWVIHELDPALKWQVTGQRRCGPVDPETREYVIEVEERSLCNLTRWTELESTFEAVETGASRCQEHQLQVQVETKCGDLAWASTEESCGWIATLPLPLECCGLAFRPEDIRDPEATVELKGCEEDSPVIGYIYPNPRPWATTPVTTCETCDDQNLIGFAVNSKTGDCKCP